MLSVSLKHKSRIDNYIKSNFDTFKEDHISPQDWKLFHTICTFLKPFYYATLKTQRDYATLDRVLFTMDMFIKYMENSLI